VGVFPRKISGIHSNGMRIVIAAALAIASVSACTRHGAVGAAGSSAATQTAARATTQPASVDAASQKRCVLKRGPFRSRGIPFLAPNLIVYWSGEYTLNSESIRAYFTVDSVQVQPSWLPHRCGPYQLEEVSNGRADGKVIYYYRSTSNWSLFFELPATISDACPFVQTFIERFVYFRSSLSQDGSYASPDAVPFPAILNLP